jgi:hypothetical protein
MVRKLTTLTHGVKSPLFDPILHCDISRRSPCWQHSIPCPNRAERHARKRGRGRIGPVLPFAYGSALRAVSAEHDPVGLFVVVI